MAEIQKVTIHNKLSASFREIHVDGAYGGFTPRGLFNLNFFAERAPIPKSAEFELKPDNTLSISGTPSNDSKTGILREYEFGIYMDINVAKTMVELMQKAIGEYENLIAQVNNPKK